MFVHKYFRVQTNSLILSFQLRWMVTGFFLYCLHSIVAIFDCFLQKPTRIQISNRILWSSNYIIFFCFVQFCNRKQYRHSFNFFIWNIDFELNFMSKLFDDYVFIGWHWNYGEEQTEKKIEWKLNLHLNESIEMQIDFIKFLFEFEEDFRNKKYDCLIGSHIGVWKYTLSTKRKKLYSRYILYGKTSIKKSEWKLLSKGTINTKSKIRYFYSQKW